jgi:hypothetical protein
MSKSQNAWSGKRLFHFPGQSLFLACLWPTGPADPSDPDCNKCQNDGGNAEVESGNAKGMNSAPEDSGNRSLGSVKLSLAPQTDKSERTRKFRFRWGHISYGLSSAAMTLQMNAPIRHVDLLSSGIGLCPGAQLLTVEGWPLSA